MQNTPQLLRARANTLTALFDEQRILLNNAATYIETLEDRVHILEAQAAMLEQRLYEVTVVEQQAQ